jgi:TatD DNase family protein
MLFDTHAHYDDGRFDADRDALLASMPKSGVSLIMHASIDASASRFGASLADKYPYIYFAAGVHPHNAKDMDDTTIPELLTILEHKKALAVGETGLDYHHNLSPHDVQQLRFRDQLELARAVKKPVIVHERDAFEDTMDILRDYPDLTGVFHCYYGSWENAKRILDIGFNVSFTGYITFKNQTASLETVAKIPSDRFMIETDCPYLSPEPVRGGRNDSLRLKYIAQTVADARGISFEQAAELSRENGKRLFGIE